MEYDGEQPERREAGAVFITHLRQSLSMWTEASGFVPLVIRNDGHSVPEAIALPFVIQRRGHRADPFVATADGIQAEVKGLRTAWDQAWRTAVQCGWVTEGDFLQARMIGLSPAMAGLPEGNSATLPFFIAIFHCARALRVPPLDWAASGEMDMELPDLGALSLEWQAKQRLIDSIGIPENRRFLSVRADSDFEHLLSSSFSAYEIQPNLEKTKLKLQQIDDLMRNARPDLGVLASQLDRLMDSVADLSGIQWDACRSLGTKLRADLYCHQGTPDRCIQLLPEIASTTTKEGCDALIRIAVAMTDLCKHDESDHVIAYALGSAEKLSALDRHVVRLHALGSRGQGRMYKSLETSDISLAESGRKDLEEALHLAKELDVGAAHDKLAQPRNLTYLLLWHALFDPVQAGELYLKAAGAARESRHGDGYVQRAAHLARYRALLSRDANPLPWWPTVDPPIPDPVFADGWPAATALKYRGAFRAHAGDIEDAQRDFDRASEILKPTAGWLLSFIRATILLQAGESLIASKPQAAEGFLLEAASLFETVHGFDLIHPRSPVAPERWLLRTKHLLDHGSPSQCNPQLFYQY